MRPIVFAVGDGGHDRPHQHHHADAGQQGSENGWEIAGSHATGGAERMRSGQHDGRHAKGRERATAPEVLALEELRGHGVSS